MILVLNEWVFHDLLFENDEPAFHETAQFLDAFEKSKMFWSFRPRNAGNERHFNS